jgi:FAD-dependent urate hydroxylase
MTTGKPRTAMVIGAGIAGAASAIALTKAGIRTTVYEARDDGADTTGIMLNLAPNGFNALRALDAADAVTSLGFETPGITLRNHRGRILGTTTTGATGAGTVARTMRRADLTAALQAEAVARGVRIERSWRLRTIHENTDSVAAEFAGGRSAEADILVGADGVHSTVRSELDPQAPPPTYSGLITTGGYARGVPVPTRTGSYEMIFGKRAFFGYATAPDGEVWWFVNLPYRPEPQRREVEAVPEARWRKRFAEVFVDDSGPALDLIAATADFAPMTPIHSMPSVPRWHSRRVVLVGDAAHAPSPTSGQGASLSIEDAATLALSLLEADTAATGFARYEKTRRPRVERIVRAAARMNNNKAPGAVGRVLRDAMLPTVLKLATNSKASRAIHEHHVEWHTPTTGEAAR